MFAAVVVPVGIDVHVLIHVVSLWEYSEGRSCPDRNWDPVKNAEWVSMKLWNIPWTDSLWASEIFFMRPEPSLAMNLSNFRGNRWELWNLFAVLLIIVCGHGTLKPSRWKKLSRVGLYLVSIIAIMKFVINLSLAALEKLIFWKGRWNSFIWNFAVILIPVVFW